MRLTQIHVPSFTPAGLTAADRTHGRALQHATYQKSVRVRQRPGHSARQPERQVWRTAAGDDNAATSASPAASTPEAAEQDTSDETVFYEGNGSNAELALSVLLGATLIYLPLTLASIGRRLWISYKFTNKRVVVTTNSPVLKREVQLSYNQIREVRAAQRALGLWGDVVIFTKDGSRLELVGLERAMELKAYMEQFLSR